MRREQTYWICQLAGWSGLMGLAFATQTVLFGFSWAKTAAMALAGGLGVLLSHAYRRFVHRSGWLRLPLAPLIPRIIVGSLALSLILTAVIIPIAELFGGLDAMASELGAAGMLTQLLNWSFIFLAWSSVYFGVHWLEDLQRTRVEKWRLEAAVKEAELKALKSQLNPHFLFNSLNNLRGLIVENPERAQQAVTQLAGLLRYALKTSKATTVLLEEELRIVRYYLELEAVRLEERLQVEMDIDESLLKAPIPPMLLQSLVENGIKHGVAARPEGGRLSLSARRNGSSYLLQIGNSGQIEEGDGDLGVGLENAKARLRLIFGDSALLQLRNLPNQEVQVQVEIPWAEGGER